MKCLALCLSLLLPCLSFAETITPQLVVKGDATVHMPADQMELVIGVVTQNPDSGKAVQDNNVKMRKVIDAIQNTGLTVDDYQTGNFNIQPVYKYPQNEAAKLMGYEVTNTLKIKTQKIDLADKIIGAAAGTGANKVESIVFNLKDPHSYKDLAIQQAAQHALSDARALAQTTQVKLVRVLNLSLDQTQNHFPRPMAYASAKMVGGADNSYDAPIEIGDVEISATVSITFEIESYGNYSKINMN
jgi:uncharacterized protein